MELLDRLKNLDLERMDVDEMVAISAAAKSLRQEYELLALNVPDWLDTRQGELRREINTRVADLREKRKKELRNKLATLKTAEEKRADLTKELQALEAQG